MSRNLISKASVYRAEFPSSLDVEMALESNPYQPPQGVTPTSVGFVPVGETENLVAEFSGGYAFALRVGDKVVPSSTLKAEVQKQLAHIEQVEGRKPGRRERKDIAEEVRGTLVMRALTKETTVVGYYHEASRLLFLNTSSQRLCDIAMTALVRAVDTLKTTTIHVSVNAGLTTRLSAWLQDDEGETAFGDFEPTGRIALSSLDKRALNIKTESLLANSEALREALRTGYQVKSMGLTDGETSFVINDKFKFGQIKSLVEAESDGDELTWAGQAYMEVTGLVKVAERLCTMFGFAESKEN